MYIVQILTEKELSYRRWCCWMKLIPRIELINNLRIYVIIISQVIDYTPTLHFRL